MIVESASRLTMRRPYSVLLKDNSVELYLAFESKEEKNQWMDIMNQVRLHDIPMQPIMNVGPGSLLSPSHSEHV